jgi:hypothetical protein
VGQLDFNNSCSSLRNERVEHFLILNTYDTLFARLPGAKKIDPPKKNRPVYVHHLPALISSYLAGDNTSSKKLPATKDSAV